MTSELRSVIDCVADQIPDDIRASIPNGVELALKATNPDWTTFGGFRWAYPGHWTEMPEGDTFNPNTCDVGGLHVAKTIGAARLGGGSIHHMLIVAYDASQAGPWQAGKRKVTRALSVWPITWQSADLQRSYLRGADLRGAFLQDADLRDADLRGAFLQDADLRGAYLRGADLRGADLQRANLQRAVVRGAFLQGAVLQRANLQRAVLQGAFLQGSFLQGADLQGADLQDADLRDADLQFAVGRIDWDDLIERGAIR